MQRFHWLAFLIASFPLVVGGCSSAKTVPKPVPKRIPKVEPAPINVSTLPLKYKDHNVVFISFDALQAAHAGFLGYERDVTPTLDAFAQDCFIFENQISVASWTVPSSMSWFTGVYPTEHRLTNKFAVYSCRKSRSRRVCTTSPRSSSTLAEILKQNGYATGGFTGNAGVSGVFGFDQGFDVYFHETEIRQLRSERPGSSRLAESQSRQKFFLFLHGYDCHGQMHAEPAALIIASSMPNYDRKFTGSVQEQEVLREEGLEQGQVHAPRSRCPFLAGNL